MSTFIVVLLLLTAVVLAIRKLVKDFRSGKHCGNCSACSHPCAGQQHTEGFQETAKGESRDDT